MLIALFIWLLAGIGIMFVVPQARNTLMSFIDECGFWCSLLGTLALILINPALIIVGTIIRVIKGIKG